MPILHFKGKSVIQNHHHTVKFHELEAVKSKGTSEEPSLDDNLIIHGDNLIGLKALLPTYAGKVKCIYIDPPYNTGNEHWKYNDNVNSPMIKEWLGKEVARDDLSRHDKWCCMMYPRLTILHELLSEDGVLYVSIGDDEVGYLIILLNEIFGEEKQIAKLTWKSRSKPTNAGNAKFRPQKVAEYILAYTKSNPESIPFNLVSGDERIYPETDSEGRFRTTTIMTSNRGMFQRETMRTTLPNGYKPSDEQRWKVGEDEILNLYEKGRIIFNDGSPLLKVYEQDEDELLYPFYTFVNEDLSSTAEAGKTELNKILGNNHGFDTVKPVNLLKYLFYISTKKNDIILDSFAGSGTTAHAVLELNAEDKGDRRFILLECEDYADKLTAERVRRVSKGVKDSKDDNLKKGLGGTFSFFELGKPIDIDKMLDGKELPSFENLAHYAFFTSTGETFKPKKMSEKEFYIGSSSAYEVFMLYTSDADKLRGMALNLDFAQKIEKKFPGKPKLVFAPACFLEEFDLRERNIRFAQLPFEIYRLAD